MTMMASTTLPFAFPSIINDSITQVQADKSIFTAFSCWYVIGKYSIEAGYFLHLLDFFAAIITSFWMLQMGSQLHIYHWLTSVPAYSGLWQRKLLQMFMLMGVITFLFLQLDHPMNRKLITMMHQSARKGNIETHRWSHTKVVQEVGHTPCVSGKYACMCYWEQLTIYPWCQVPVLWCAPPVFLGVVWVQAIWHQWCWYNLAGRSRINARLTCINAVNVDDSHHHHATWPPQLREVDNTCSYLASHNNVNSGVAIHTLVVYAAFPLQAIVFTYCYCQNIIGSPSPAYSLLIGAAWFYQC